MTGIEGISRLRAVRMAPRVVTRSGFQMPAEQADAHPGVAAAAPAVALSPMLALQEMGTEPAADRDALRHGNDMLAALAGIQRALLTGGHDAMALQRLADLAETVPLAADTRLAALLSAIVVRVRVELARRQAAHVSAR